MAVHTAWGSFWIGWGILELLVATHVLPPIPLGMARPSFAFWFIALTLVTSFGALAQNLGVFTVLGTMSAGSALTAAGFYVGSLATVRAGGWLFVISAAAAWLVAGAMVLEHSFGRTIIPLGKWSAPASSPDSRHTGSVRQTGFRRRTRASATPGREEVTEMNISEREQQALVSIEEDLAGSVPELAAKLAVFTRLAAGGACAPSRTARRRRGRRQGRVSTGPPRLKPGGPAQPVSEAGSRPLGRSRHAGCRCR